MPDGVCFAMKISAPIASPVGMGNVISSPMATQVARKRDKTSLPWFANTHVAGSCCRWMLTTRSRQMGTDGLEVTTAIPSAGILGGLPGNPKRGSN